MEIRKKSDVTTHVFELSTIMQFGVNVYLNITPYN